MSKFSQIIKFLCQVFKLKSVHCPSWFNKYGFWDQLLNQQWESIRRGNKVPKSLFAQAYLVWWVARNWNRNVAVVENVKLCFYTWSTYPPFTCANKCPLLIGSFIIFRAEKFRLFLLAVQKLDFRNQEMSKIRISGCPSAVFTKLT